MSFMSLTSTSNDDPNVSLSKMNLEECKHLIAKKEYGKLVSASKQFTVANLKDMEELSKQWMILFLFNVHILAEDELKSIKRKFIGDFGENTFKVLFFKELLLICQEQQEEEKNVLLITKACKMFSEKTLQVAGREVALGWTALFAKHAQKIDNKSLGFAFNCFHNNFFLQPGEIKYSIQVVCLNRQQQELPLALLLTYIPFQKRFTVKTNILRIENTSNKVIVIFKEYLYKKKLPKEMITMDHLIELIDFARTRWIQDETLIEICLERIKSSKCEENEYLKQASIAAIAGDVAFKQKNFPEAKQFYSDAVKQRNRDYLSHATLGKIAMKQKKYKRAAIEFENASQFALFSHKLHFYQSKSLVEYVKQFERKIEEFQANSLLLIKKLYFEENIRRELKTFLESLEKYFLENNGLVGEFALSREIIRGLELVQDDEMDLSLTSSSKTSSQEETFEGRKPIAGKFFYEDLQNLHLQFNEAIARVKERLLFKAEILLEKLPLTTNNEIEKISFILQRLLKEEILYERGQYEEAGYVFDQIEKMIRDNIITLNSKEKVCFYDNLSKLSMANGQIEPAKRALSELIFLEPQNKEFQLRHMSCQDEMIFWYESEFNEQDIDAQYKIGLVQYNKAIVSSDKKEDEKVKKYYENAKKHFLKADPYNAYVNFYLGKIERPSYYFKKALKIALFDKLEFSFCLDIAEHFLKNGAKESIFTELITLFSSDIFSESDPEKIYEILHRLAEKIENEEDRQFVLLTMEKLHQKFNYFPHLDHSKNDRPDHLAEINEFVPSMDKGEICSECLTQKLYALANESSEGDPHNELAFQEIAENAIFTTIPHNHFEKIEIQTADNVKQPTKLIDEDKIRANLKRAFFRLGSNEGHTFFAA
ncbi:MAG: hypothetical protein H0T62_11275, partial [Parachlamydiaceae bacterium]|nr:hypothetical protein [Parachlamydiaceae bacterium]